MLLTQLPLVRFSVFPNINSDAVFHMDIIYSLDIAEIY